MTRIGLDDGPFDDLYHRLMRAPWSVFVGAFAAAYLLINLIFAGLYAIDLAGIQNAKAGSFSDAFMFSVQTMATIGYGHLAPSSTYINVIVVLEAMTALLSLSLWSGLAFARFSRPTSRVMFSKVAVVTRDQTVPTLMFRVANGRGNRIVDATISVTLLRDEVSPEGTQWRRQINLALVRDRSPVFVLSWTVMHRLDESSPLQGAFADPAQPEPVELIISLTGIDDTFAQSIHAMHGYGPDDIHVGKRFADMSSRDDTGRPVLDFRRFDEIVAEG